ncbi:hypothetical protein Pcinc_007293 [Petrolisthes cinctipes]|uniref:Major facilitator superfamily (MFS) profile domain-containing protein n=1 Tax=Petrolisthes cinctipes TaxID=88211 RepID=A0AAE1GB76_PETCI|nr:hypothetical protein Pcinc_007293 [Petrolisthes cinctipes]
MVLGFLGCAVEFILRYSLSVAIVAMVNSTSTTNTNTTHNNDNQTQHDDVCLVITNTTQAKGTGEYNWSEQQEAIILGIFFWGYFITKVPGALERLSSEQRAIINQSSRKQPDTLAFNLRVVETVVLQCVAIKGTIYRHSLNSSLELNFPAGGRISDMVGGRITLSVCLGTCGVLSLLSPLAASLHPLALAGVRLVMGLLQGVYQPALYSVLNRWALPKELGSMISITFSGMSLGMVIGLGCWSWVVETMGWRWAFYGSGLLAVAWTPLWFLLVRDDPQHHPFISLKEKERLNGITVQPRNSSTVIVVVLLVPFPSQERDDQTLFQARL